MYGSMDLCVYIDPVHGLTKMRKSSICLCHSMSLFLFAYGIATAFGFSRQDSLLSRFLDRFYKAVQNFPLSTLLSRTPEIGKTAVPKFFCASTCCPATRKTVECYPEIHEDSVNVPPLKLSKLES
ncbi:hypothetical protein M5K25_006585 [Dendrobium thyrsiflorum]|uniref:Uncharacterized protein n=1 Tax=Dendrobium thyrsiflorum TaxID=117978 RepID=A0ABD0VD78_DENTH